MPWYCYQTTTWQSNTCGRFTDGNNECRYARTDVLKQGIDEIMVHNYKSTTNENIRAIDIKSMQAVSRKARKGPQRRKDFPVKPLISI